MDRKLKFIQAAKQRIPQFETKLSIPFTDYVGGVVLEVNKGLRFSLQ